MKRFFKIYLSLFGFLFLLTSCSEKDEKSEFSVHESGLEYKFVEEKTDQQLAKPGDILVLDVKWYYEPNDSLLFDSREIGRSFKELLKKPFYKGGSWEDALSLLHKGDSIVFKIDAVEFYRKKRGIQPPEFVTRDSKLRFHVRLLDIQTYQEVEREQDLIYNSSADIEKKLLVDYLEITNTTVEPTKEGLYFVADEKFMGTGDPAVEGQVVTVHFIGSFVDGRPFANSYKVQKPFTFQLGKSDVIEGFNIGILGMKKEQRARLVIPSNLGYGKDGDKVFKIPPFATLVFEIEILDIK
ncbi:MAG: FKBP-type peptidyl-prolyl cis-trans isomerase [Bacteroidales bacterium]|nr:FKBP-type peptidyl-prolyl cis-trans isomerase [Bacteroidales bacterium]